MDENEYGPDILTLSDEDGVEYTFEVIDSVDIDDQHYLALLPYKEGEEESEEEEGEFVILKTEMEGEDEILVPIEDPDEMNSVFETFMNRLDDLYEFRDGDHAGNHDCDCDHGCDHGCDHDAK